MLQLLNSSFRRCLVEISCCNSSLWVNSTFQAVQRPLENLISHYEEVIGLKTVKDAQYDVIKSEKKLSLAQKARRDVQIELRALQNRLKDIHAELGRTARGEDRYLFLLTEEHATIKKERQLTGQMEVEESNERDAFHDLSNKVRTSHERERERGEKTKYWSISASLIGALMGIIGTTIASELRMRRIKEMISSTSQLSPFLEQLTSIISKQNAEISSFINDVHMLMQFKKTSKLELAVPIDDETTERIVEKIGEHSRIISMEMDDLKRLIAVDRGAGVENVVYVGADMEKLLDRTEKNIESKLKLQVLLATVCLYAAIGISIPFIVSLFRS